MDCPLAVPCQFWNAYIGFSKKVCLCVCMHLCMCGEGGVVEKKQTDEAVVFSVPESLNSNTVKIRGKNVSLFTRVLLFKKWRAACRISRKQIGKEVYARKSKYVCLIQFPIISFHQATWLFSDVCKCNTTPVIRQSGPEFCAAYFKGTWLNVIFALGCEDAKEMSKFVNHNK